jgi:hypothetical protein
MKLIFFAEVLGEMRNAYRSLVGKPEGKRQHRIRRYIWEENIKWILRIWGRRCGLNSTGPGQGLVHRFRTSGTEPSSFIRGGEFLDQLSVVWASEEVLWSTELVCSLVYGFYFSTLFPNFLSLPYSFRLGDEASRPHKMNTALRQEQFTLTGSPLKQRVTTRMSEVFLCYVLYCN